MFSEASNLDIEGNDHADKLAEKAAASACVPLNVSVPIKYYSNLITRIQNRLATILVSLPKRQSDKHRTPKISRTPLSELIQASAHSCVEDEQRVQCSLCLNSFKKSDPALRHWLSNQCIGYGPDLTRPIPLLRSQVHLGNRITHASHKLFKYKGLIYCKVCGSRAGALGLKKLSKPCLPPTAYGRTFLNALHVKTVNEKHVFLILNIRVCIPSV